MDKKSFKILTIGGNPLKLTALKKITGDIFPEALFIHSTVKSGIKMCRTEKPDLILVECEPGMDGSRSCAAIKTATALKNIPVIMLTSDLTTSEIKIRALDAGADGFLPQTPDVPELKAQFRAMLRLKEAEELKSGTGQPKLAEKELQDERNLLRTLIDRIPFPVYVMDIKGRKVIANKADVENICCSTESEVIGKTDLELFPGEIGKRGYADCMSVIQTGKPIIDLAENFINNGVHRWLLTSQYPLHNSNGRIKGLVGIGYEVTERKKAEDEMRHSHYLMSYIIEHSNSAIAVHDKDLRYIYVSNSYLSEYNIKDQNIIGKHHYEVFPDIPQKWKEVHQNGLNGIVSSSDEDLYIREDGSEWWTRWECRPWYESDGQIGGIIIYTEVITERKKMEEKIIKSEAYYRALIDLSPDGIIISDYEGNISYGSKKALEILNVPEGKAITGSSILSFFAPESIQSILDRVSDILTGSLSPETREYRLKKYNGKMFWGELSSSPLADMNGNPAAMMIIFRDITERKTFEYELIKSKERAVESDRLKTAFLHNISHEIRTPMNAVIGFASLLKETELNPETQKPLVDVIIQSSNHLLAVVSDIIEISNIEAGLAKVNDCELRLNEILYILLEQFKLSALTKGVSLKLETGLPDKEAVIRSDKTKLTQILSNLLSNSLKFISEGEVIFGYTPGKDNIEFFVSDTGIGIPEEHHNKVFERFYQVENTLAKQYDGTGLGLSISKAYVELLGGKIWMKSQAGKGSVFFFTIPAAVLK